MTTKIIGLTGKRGSGKDSAAQALIDIGYKRLSFADPLKRIVEIAYGVTQEEMADPILKEKVLDRFPFKSPREILTHIGTECFRDYIDTTWIEALKREASKYEKVVIADVRYLNEAECIHSMNGYVVRVVRPSLTRAADDVIAQHRSETEMDEIVPNYTIVNDGTMERLHGLMSMVCEVYEAERV